MDNYRANGVLGGQVQQRDGLYTNKQILHVALIIISIINTGILGTNMSVCFKSEYYSKKNHDAIPAAVYLNLKCYRPIIFVLRNFPPRKLRGS